MIGRRSFLTAAAGWAATASAPAQKPVGACNVLDFGAAGDGSTLNTTPIQAAIDACHAAGGGRVIVPPGVFVTGTIRLKSNVTLHLESGARIQGSRNQADYPKDAGLCDWHTKFNWGREFTGTLIYAEGVENIGLEGTGIIDGSQGAGKDRVFPNPGDPERRRPMLIRFRDCRNVRVRDVTLVRPASFTTLFVGCRDMLFDGVRVRSRDTGNGDGFDFDGCERVRIANCDLETGDDSIGLKSMIPDRPTQDFVITNCVLSSSWAALRMGPESFQDMRNIVVSNCLFKNCRDGFKLQSCEGAAMERMIFSNILMEGVYRPFFVTLNIFSMSKHAPPGRPGVGTMRDIHATNIQAVVPKNSTGQGYDMPCVAFVGYPGQAIEDVTLSDFRLAMPGGGTPGHAARMNVPELLDETKRYPEAPSFGGELPASGIYLRHVRGFRLSNSRISTAAPDARAFLAGDDLEDISLNGVTGSGSASAAGLVKFGNARDVNLANCGLILDGKPGRGRPLSATLTPEEQAKLAAVPKR
jgi:hypothetical protein